MSGQTLTCQLTLSHKLTHTNTQTRIHPQYDRITDQPENPISVTKTQSAHTLTERASERERERVCQIDAHKGIHYRQALS